LVFVRFEGYPRRPPLRLALDPESGIVFAVSPGFLQYRFVSPYFRTQQQKFLAIIETPQYAT
jgi:hypothetical protein